MEYCFKQNYFDKFTKLIGENAGAILRQRGKVKITDQSEALLKQKLWFNTKKKRTTALHQGWKWAFKISLRHSSFTSFSNGVPTPKKNLGP